ncbi:hypothetical protein SAY87_015604 [Trapa incisa]|uniref:MLO-like protein n=1 Tax=Trapa incisa TaxID=236973 RepID=A0AAN7LAW2_9MYRT|nr:hypothetical protein SAY87_015604 [Trapa incisa]
MIFLISCGHFSAQWLKKKHKRALKEAEEATLNESSEDSESNRRRKLLSLAGGSVQSLRRVLAAASTDKCAAKGKVPFVSADGIHQLHIFIFILAVFHVIYCVLTMVLGQLKMRRWKAWEKETRTAEYQFSHGWKSYLWFPFIPLVLAFFAWTWVSNGDSDILLSTDVLFDIKTSVMRFSSSKISMGSTMKPTIFDEKVAVALRNWHQTAKKNIKQNKGSLTPMSSRPATPSHHMSPVHLLRHYRGEINDSLHTSLGKSNLDASDQWGTDSPSHPHFLRPGEGSSSSHHNHRHQFPGHQYHQQETELTAASAEWVEAQGQNQAQVAPAPQPQHNIDIGPRDFSFDKRTGGT